MKKSTCYFLLFLIAIILLQINPVQAGYGDCLAYDSYSDTDNKSEVLGPNNETCPELTWSGSSWTVTGGTSSNSPTLGSEEVPDNNAASTGTEADTTTGYSPNNDAVVSSVTDNRTGSSGTKSINMLPTLDDKSSAYFTYSGTTNDWYLLDLWFKNEGSASFGIYEVSIPKFLYLYLDNTSWTNRNDTFRSGSGSKVISLYSFTSNKFTRIDDVSLKKISHTSLFRTVDVGATEVTISVTVPSYLIGTQAGIISGLDNSTSPTEYLIAYLTGNGKIILEQYLSGTYSTIIDATSITWGASKIVEISRSGNDIDLYYDNTLIGSGSCDNSITGTLSGTFSTFSNNTFDNFFVTDNISNTPTSTNTSTPTSTSTSTPTSTNTSTPTSTNTSTPTSTNTSTPTSTNTSTPTPTDTYTPTPTPTETTNPAWSQTPSLTMLPQTATYVAAYALYSSVAADNYPTTTLFAVLCGVLILIGIVVFAIWTTRRSAK